MLKNLEVKGHDVCNMAPHTQKCAHITVYWLQTGLSTYINTSLYADTDIINTNMRKCYQLINLCKGIILFYSSNFSAGLTFLKKQVEGNFKIPKFPKISSNITSQNTPSWEVTPFPAFPRPFPYVHPSMDWVKEPGGTYLQSIDSNALTSTPLGSCSHLHPGKA